MKKKNRVEYTGRLTAVPELVQTKGDNVGLKFSLAHDVERWNKDEGKMEKTGTDFIRCIYWTKSSKFWLERIGKGKEVTVEGRLRQNTWETEGGEKRSEITIVVDDFNSPWLTKIMTDEAEKGSKTGGSPNTAGFDDDIPF